MREEEPKVAVTPPAPKAEPKVARIISLMRPSLRSLMVATEEPVPAATSTFAMPTLRDVKERAREPASTVTTSSGALFGPRFCTR